MTSAVATRSGAPALGRVAAVLAVASTAVHLLQVTADSLASLAMVLMAVACLPCAWHLWRAPTRSAWRLTAGIDVGMLVLHLPLTTGMSPGEHHVGGAPHGLMWLGIALVVGQLGLAARFALSHQG